MNHDINVIARRMDALNGTFAVRININGAWYATINAEIKESSVLRSLAYHAEDLDSAILGLWDLMTDELAPDEYIVINATDPERRRHYRWSHPGCIWEELR